MSDLAIRCVFFCLMLLYGITFVASIALGIYAVREIIREWRAAR